MHNLRKHTSIASPNRMGLAAVLAYNPATTAARRAAPDPLAARVLWERQQEERLAPRRWLWWGLAGLAAVAIARATLDQPLWAAWSSGCCWSLWGRRISFATTTCSSRRSHCSPQRRTEVAGISLTLVLAAGVVARMSHLELANQFAAQSLLVLLAFGFVASAFLTRPQQPH